MHNLKKSSKTKVKINNETTKLVFLIEVKIKKPCFLSVKVVKLNSKLSDYFFIKFVF